MFLPPETPMLNPTEYFFSEVKQLVRSISYKQHRAYGAVATELLESMREKKMQSHFFSIRPYMELALRQQSFK
jgi:transposase